MNIYEIRAFSPQKTIVKRVSAKSAQSAETKFRRSHTRSFEEIQIARVKNATQEPGRTRI